MDEKEARKKLQKILDWHYSHYPNYSESNLSGKKGDGFIEFYITRMYSEFGNKWDEHRAVEFINALAAEQGLRDI